MDEIIVPKGSLPIDSCSLAQKFEKIDPRLSQKDPTSHLHRPAVGIFVDGGQGFLFA
jgi:hypothetical protein